MNKVIKISFGLLVVATLVLVGIFMSEGPVAAQNADVSCNSATLWGTVYTNNEDTLAWFEWGPTTSLQYTTPKQSFAGRSDSFPYTYSQSLTQLKENTTYYWRAMAQNKFGTAAGSMKSFTTGTCTTPPPPPPPPLPPPPSPVTVSLSASSFSIPYGGSVTLSWQTSGNPSQCIAQNDWSGQKSVNGGSERIDNLTRTSLFAITCSNATSGDSDFVNVTVGTQPPPPPPPPPPPTPVPTVNLSADQPFVNFGGSTFVRWFPTNNPTSCTGFGGTNNWAGPKQTGNGSFFTGSLLSTTTFSMTCSNAAGSSNPESVTVQVGSQPPPPQPPPPQPPPPPPPPPAPSQPSVDLSADDTSIDFDDNTIIRWTSNSAVVSCQASGGSNGWSGLKPPSGSFPTGNLTSDKTYNITCFNSAGASDFDSVTVNVDQSSGGNISVDLTADDTSIDEGDSTTIRWDSDNADDCDPSGGTNGWSSRNIGTSGSFDTGDLDSDESFSITCTNDDGDSDSDSVTIRVDDDNNNNSGSVSVDIRADDTSIDEGDSTRVRWNSSNADFCEGEDGDNGWDGEDLGEDGSFSTGRLTRDTTFRITCENDDDDDSDSVTIRVNEDNNQTSGNAPTAVTTSAINISSTSAQLNSLILNSEDASATAWFEWGPTISLGNVTSRDPVGRVSSVVHSATVTGLLPGRVYYYRASAENTFGRSNGSTLSFITNEVATVTPPPTVVRTTTVVRGVSTSPLVKLTIDGGAEVITAGERRYYHVEWENTSSQTLRDVIVRVLLPDTMLYEGANKGSFSLADNSLNLDVGNLSPDEGDDLFLIASAKRGTRDGELIVVVANLVYTDASGTQGDAIAYANHRFTTASNGSTLGALSLFGGDFLPDTFFGWLLLLILLLILIALLRYLFSDLRYREAPPPARPLP